MKQNININTDDKKNSPSILVATLGATWQVIPEIFAALDPDKCNLYKEHDTPECFHNIQQLSDTYSIDELWIITSQSKNTQKGIEQIQLWCSGLKKPVSLRVLIAAETDQVTSAKELDHIRELIFRSVLKATEIGNVICSLAGGRKTMSADLQRAASIFGTQGLLHIVAPEPLPDSLKCNDYIFWNRPLTPEDAKLLLPAWIGRYNRREILDTYWNNLPPIHSKRFPLSLSNTELNYFHTDSISLVDEVSERERDAQKLLGNYLAFLAESERHENWRHLYRLPPRLIEDLRTTSLDERFKPLIQAIPKAELHCHLGGIPDLDTQIKIGHAIWKGMTKQEQSYALETIYPLMQKKSIWDWNWPSTYIPRNLAPIDRSKISAALLVNVDRSDLELNLFDVTQPRVGLIHQTKGFSAYERPGELTGSAVLGHPLAIPCYIQAINDYVDNENIAYLELRGSPHKYSNAPIGWLKAFRDQLKDSDTRMFRFIWILDRRASNTKEIINEAMSAFADEALRNFIVGFDLAGDESQSSPHELASAFLPIFEACIPVTIHAGEGQTPENIWQAAYNLNADRIGHGLTLAEKPSLLTRFRNKGICLELCPTSNIEVIGFYDPLNSNTSSYSKYPLKSLWDQGISLTINTDNPGISNSGLSDEYLLASRLSGGISLWDTLAIIKQGYVHSMIDTALREVVLKRYDKEIFDIISNYKTTRKFE
ncbi:adenosine deaminase [Nitrincola tibetensis]|uniref:adenosine deaminase n=1 Tax=Nitrincola tibetensis TaxID=2219697 RepID=A0A364NKK1_9GAMM|nr:CRISPR-associated ring nuclease [Nitrincola tibetensis]RAU17616.1 adenosine deaminase [Nitrincola tibetensis]